MHGLIPLSIQHAAVFRELLGLHTYCFRYEEWSRDHCMFHGLMTPHGIVASPVHLLEPQDLFRVELLGVGAFRYHFTPNLEDVLFPFPFTLNFPDPSSELGTRVEIVGERLVQISDFLRDLRKLLSEQRWICIQGAEHQLGLACQNDTLFALEPSVLKEWPGELAKLTAPALLARSCQDRPNLLHE